MAMCLNVILQNLSLAFSTVAFYQIVRVLLTPLVALIDFFFYGKTIPRKAAWALIPTCLGVVVVSYYDTKEPTRVQTKKTTIIGIIFAFSGIAASSIYTIWIGTYQKRFEMDSMQLLFNQAPLSAFLLLYAIPVTDSPPAWSQVPLAAWELIVLVCILVNPLQILDRTKRSQSGLLASLINISQFFIISKADALSSTVVGHVKTISIVALGWVASRRTVSDGCTFGIVMAIAGVVG